MALTATQQEQLRTLLKDKHLVWYIGPRPLGTCVLVDIDVLRNRAYTNNNGEIDLGGDYVSLDQFRVQATLSVEEALRVKPPVKATVELTIDVPLVSW